jgi:hypothetical protein
VIARYCRIEEECDNDRPFPTHRACAVYHE